MTPCRQAFEQWRAATAAPDGIWHEDEQRYTLLSGIQHDWDVWNASSAVSKHSTAKSLVTVIPILGWYAEEANAIARNLLNRRNEAVLASCNVLAMDAGKRADQAANELSSLVKEQL